MFFDDDGNITLNSLISTSSNTTPDATTLATWIGVNDAYAEWVGITNDNIVDTSKIAVNTTFGKKPKFITNGVIESKNGNSTIDFLSDTRFLDADANIDLDSGKSYTVLSISTSSYKYRQ